LKASERGSLEASERGAWKLQKGELGSFKKGSLKVRILVHGGSDSHGGVLEIGEMVISAFIGLVGLGPASRVFTFHLDSLLTATTNISICPHMTSCSNASALGVSIMSASRVPWHLVKVLRNVNQFNELLEARNLVY
jgi:hypothetical protein